MTNIDRTKPVLVTGATGFVAGWLVKKLLEEGFTVHAAVRNPDKKEKLQHLDKIAASSPGSIKYFKADLLTDGAYFEAMQDCELVFHTASPFFLDVKDPQKELIEPAVNGTKNVLESVNKTPSVKRVVLTSSCAAIYSDADECAQYPNGELTEEIWNTTATLDHQAYSLSKTLAEKKAWEMNKSQDRWELVVINPSFVLGPFLNPAETTSESFSIMKQMGDGTYKMGAPRMGIGVIDVRDLAEAHFRAGTLPEANGRNIISAHNTDFFEMSQKLIPKFGDKYPLPKKVAPKWLIWIVGPIVNKGFTRKMVSKNIGHVWKANNTKSVKELGMKYRPLEETMVDTFQVLVDNKII
ncbi:MAG: aldehyde reductase [Flavobacteriales bacterium]|nr:aldehyde reductase [Flavobacteriales bacterium]MCB9196368.1 aldehyde reductase [Flavobacteriales bacterium]MCB9198549.1 aldehyde reductase [Flavobacteriales bacterium]